jgi:hypothetical protein
MALKDPIKKDKENAGGIFDLMIAENRGALDGQGTGGPPPGRHPSLFLAPALCLP